MCFGDTPTSPAGVQVTGTRTLTWPSDSDLLSVHPRRQVFSLVPGLLEVHVLGKAPWVEVKAVLERRA